MQKGSVYEFFKKIELFKELTDKEHKLLAENIEIKSYESDSIIFYENTPQKYLYMIFEGEVELFKKTPLGEEKRLALFTRYDFLGESSLIDDAPHSTSARTLLNSIIVVISRDKFLEFMQRHPSVAVKILSRIVTIISRRMRLSNNKLLSAAAQYESGRTRTEHDLLGEREVPYEYYYGVQTLRAVENFTITGVTLSSFPVLIDALAMVKMAAAKANLDLNLIPENIAEAIIQACNEILNGKLHSHFVVDMIQGGAGTSTNMNANEVIANRALELMGYEKGEYKYCHPNNHINLSQSTNDVYPTAVKIAIINSNKKLIDVLYDLIIAFRMKANEFGRIIKMGRTQLQDAVPMTLGQEFEAYAVTLSEEIDRLEQNVKLFLEVNLGGTAIGTGINSDPDYSEKAMNHLRRITGFDVVLAPNLVEATQDTGSFVMYSSALKRLAVKLSKICNDLRLLSSGPRTGIGEINLPPMQPGSSIMPGKVNPVIPEVVNQVAFKVIGNDLSVTMAAEAGQLELNVMEPLIVYCIFQSIEMLKNGMATLMHRCIDGITANDQRCRQLVENSIGIVTALSPVLGYEKCTELAIEALQTNKGVYELVIEKNLLSKSDLDKLLAPENMIKPHRK
jgi:aspartate ammonia-lyase